MLDFIKEKWFILLISILILCSVIYFVMDTTKYNVSKKHVDGKDVIASIESKDVTADELMDEAPDGELLYNMYKNEVVNQSVKSSKQIEKEAKNMKSVIISNVKNQQGENYETALGAELASYGFNGYDELYEYCLMNVKQKELNQKYISKNFDTLKDSVKDLKPRTVSIIKINVANPDSLTKDEKEKLKNVEDTIQRDSFQKAATSFSEDTSTASEKGFFGYIDLSDATSQQPVLDAQLLESALSMKKGETSNWIDVADPNAGVVSKYKIYVNETNISSLFHSKDSSVKDRLTNAFLQANPTLESVVIDNAAKKINVKFQDKEVETKIENYKKTLKGENN